MNWKGYRKLDIRALRGPLSKQLMSQCGYLKKNQWIAMGDPAILMPLVYESKKKKVFETSIVLHLAENRNKDLIDRENINYINIETRDYESFIDQVVASKKIISSSLHGIILAEAYGVPAVFLMSTKNIENQMIKYYDWYWSTGRYTVKIARTIDEALAMEPMELPDLKKMQQDLLDSFPYDIFEK